MATARAITVRGEVLHVNVAHLVNGLLLIQYPLLHGDIAESQLIFMPRSANGFLFKTPRFIDVPVAHSGLQQEVLSADDVTLFGVRLSSIGMRVAFKVAGGHLTFGRTERTIPRPGTCLKVEFVYPENSRYKAQYTRPLDYLVQSERTIATPDEARWLA